MTCSNRLITDLQILATSNFTPETLARANQRLAGFESLNVLLGVALARAAELKTALMKVQTVLDAGDPQVALLNSILAALN